MSDGETTRIRMALLQAAGVAQAADEQFDLAALAQHLDASEPSVRGEVEQLDRAGLLLSGVGEEAQPPLLLSAGRQYLASGGGGVVLVDEFREQLRRGDAVEYTAAHLVPPAFAEAVDQTLSASAVYIIPLEGQRADTSYSR